MKKRYKVEIINWDKEAEQGSVTYDTDTKTVEIIGTYDIIVISFDTLNQLKTQLDDVLNYGANDAAQKGK